jgi:hypothetical protein
MEIYHQDHTPRRELISGRRPYSDSPEDYVTYVEDDHFVNGPVRNPTRSPRRREPWFRGQGMRYDDDGFFLDPPPPPINLDDYAVAEEKVNWQKDGF